MLPSMRSFTRTAPLAAAICAGLWLAAPSQAQASVVGSQGIEIEGPQDRRGFFIGVGATFGATYMTPAQTFIPPLRADFIIGGGVTKRFTLGLDMFVGGYATGRPGSKVLFGGDVEATGFVWRGLYLRGGLGGAGMPSTTGSLSAGVGGKFGIGYEFWLNQTAAMSVDLSYDLRFVPDDGMRHSPMLGVRFLWY
ncbi:MAG: hypothetical protein R3A51_17435 [Nannocystaceae bacterium]|nr:hypothetical protein [Myxococcales bacterium]